jgi:Legionella pneumophila major outer membrane protein precursor
MLHTNRLLFLSLFFCWISAFCQQHTPAGQTPDGKVNFPSNFQVEGGYNVLITGDYLYWTAREDGLYFAQKGFSDPSPSFPPSADSSSFHGTLKKLHPRWTSGARIGIGLNFPKEGYDAILYWTWFSSQSHASARSSRGSLLPLWATPDFPPPTSATRAKGHFDLNLNLLDLEWGRSSWFGGSFSLRPFFGLRGAWITQRLKTQFAFTTLPIVFERLRSEADFHGGGLRAGIDTRFALPHKFSICGLASGSLLYGQTDNGLRIKEDHITIARTKDHSWEGLSTLQMSLKLGWDSHFAKDRLHIEFHVGWESNIWFSINTMNHFMNHLRQGSYFKENGNLAMQGLVAGGRFDF